MSTPNGELKPALRRDAGPGTGLLPHRELCHCGRSGGAAARGVLGIGRLNRSGEANRRDARIHSMLLGDFATI